MSLTAKAIANRIKAKGLQKLRWYCQMCEKQCRDENGYRCHIQSQSHQQQMKLFGESPKQFIEDFSTEFQDTFVNLLSQRYGTTRVFANKVYQEVVADRNHIHMNATKWSTLSEFVKHLGREGIVHVDDTERGFYISWIDNSPHALAKRDAVLKMERQNKDQEERDRMLIQEQIERGGATAASAASSNINLPSELRRSGEARRISINLSQQKLPPSRTRGLAQPRVYAQSADHKTIIAAENSQIGLPIASAKSGRPEKRTFAVLDNILEATQERCARKRPTTAAADTPRTGNAIVATNSNPDSSGDGWLLPGIIVKVLDKRVAGGKCWNQKGKVISCRRDNTIAEIKMNYSPNDDVIEADQSQLQTSIPPDGELVMVLRGRFRGRLALVEKLHIDRYCADLRLLANSAGVDDELIRDIEYEWFSRYESFK